MKSSAGLAWDPGRMADCSLAGARVFATLDDENPVDCLAEVIEAQIEFVDVYFACDDDQHKICI